MKKTINPLTLSDIRINIFDNNSDMAKEFPGFGLFDFRHDFFMTPDHSTIAISLTFNNERHYTCPTPTGVRRTVTVILSDATGRRTIASSKLRINMAKEEPLSFHRIDMPFDYSDVDFDHTYKVTVLDDKSRKIMGECPFNVFDEHQCGNHPSRWYTAERGGIIPQYSDCLYKSTDSEDLCYNRIRFYLRPHFDIEPHSLPEVELRIHYPDGTVDQSFISPVSICPDSDRYTIEQSFLSHHKNAGVCYAELLCLDYAFAGAVFTTKGRTEQGYWSGEELECLEEYTLSDATERLNNSLPDAEAFDFDRALDEFISSCEEDSIADNNSPADPEPAESAEAETTPCPTLDSLTGLQSVKEKLSIYEKVMMFNRRRRDSGLPATPTPLHAMFLGSPGTGKTTVANMMGRMLADAGMLSKGHVVVKERSTLLGPAYSSEETNTLKAIEEARGGILLIDEAYQLYQPNDPRDPGKFVIETLLTALADDSLSDWMLILAGYPDEMRRMFDMNPGLKSRIPDSNIYMFDDFSETELMDIAVRYLQRQKYALSEDAAAALAERLKADCAARDKNFGNARHVMNLIQTDILPAMAVRVITAGETRPDALTTIEACDIPARPRCFTTPTRVSVGFRA